MDVNSVISWDFKSDLTTFMNSNGLKYANRSMKGSFGRVYELMDEKGKHYVAKISPKRSMMNNLEVNVWKQFQHPNIVGLLMVDACLQESVIFMMDFIGIELQQYLQTPSYLAASESLLLSFSFLKDILNGLKYLHGIHLCHLDLRAVNVFISPDLDIAKIGDFSGLTRANQKTRYFPLPYMFRPPEFVGHSGSGCWNKKSWPKVIDLWAYGLLAVHVILGGFFFVKLLEDSGSEWDVFLTELSKPNLYQTCIRQAYSSSMVSEEFLYEFYSFVKLFLQVKPWKRKSAETGLKHRFFSLLKK